MAKLPVVRDPKRNKERLLELMHAQEGKRGYLIAFEGPDGAGKTTQRKLFQKWLETQGHQVVTTKWSSSPLIKPLIRVRKGARAMSAEEYSLLYAADFRYRLENDVLPALWTGKMVIADGYVFTALARDGARGMRLNWVLNTYEPLFWPDSVFYFSVSAETSGKRVTAQKPPGYYDAGQDVTQIDDPVESYRQYIDRMNQEYKALSVIFNFVTVDAEQSIYEQHRTIRQLFREAQKKAWAEWNVDAVLEWLGREVQSPEVQLGL